MKLPKLPFQSRPKTRTDRLSEARDQLGARAASARDDGLSLVRSVPGRVESSRKQALAVAGAATGAAAGFAFWRSQRDQGPSVHQDPAQPKTPLKAEPPPPTKATATDTKVAAADAAGTRSK